MPVAFAHAARGWTSRRTPQKAPPVLAAYPARLGPDGGRVVGCCCRGPLHLPPTRVRHRGPVRCMRQPAAAHYLPGRHAPAPRDGRIQAGRAAGGPADPGGLELPLLRRAARRLPEHLWERGVPRTVRTAGQVLAPDGCGDRHEPAWLGYADNRRCAQGKWVVRAPPDERPWALLVRRVSLTRCPPVFDRGVSRRRVQASSCSAIASSCVSQGDVRNAC
jgi:hypothetical protein